MWPHMNTFFYCRDWECANGILWTESRDMVKHLISSARFQNVDGAKSEKPNLQLGWGTTKTYEIITEVLNQQGLFIYLEILTPCQLAWDILICTIFRVLF